MNRFFRYSSVCMCCVLLLSAFACTREVEQPGVVATVNGKPIHMKEVEARYDLDNLGWSGGYVPTVDTLRAEYGKALSELIIIELIMQKLNAMGLAITDEDVAAAESVVRQDYPEGQFEKVLVEDYIDIEVWRSMLREQLSVERFKTDVLRPSVKLSYQEAEQYYKEHVSDFYLPPRISFIYISGAAGQKVEKARDKYLETQEIDAVRNAFDDVSIREMRMKRTRLPEAWSKHLDALEVGDSTEVFSGEYGFEALVLLEKLEEKVLGPSRAYPLVEKVLIEKKLNDAFVAWLEKQLGNATIKITALLREDEFTRNSTTGNPDDDLSETSDAVDSGDNAIDSSEEGMTEHSSGDDDSIATEGNAPDSYAPDDVLPGEEGSLAIPSAE